MLIWKYKHNSIDFCYCYRAQARGPKYPQYELKLEVECQAHWENGRQQCEAASMTGNPCKRPKHSSEQEHMSGFIYNCTFIISVHFICITVIIVAVCDCGRKIGPREDPYTAIQANYLFYQQVGKECCAKLERIEFPIFEPSIKEFKAATINDTEDVMSVLSDRSVQLSPEVRDYLFSFILKSKMLM